MIRRISAEKRFVLAVPRTVWYRAVLAVVVISAGTALANSPPDANAGPDQTIFLGDSTVMQGSATDPDGDPITAWQWFIESQPTGSVPIFGPVTSQTPDFLPDMLGDYLFSLMASDGISGFGLPDFVMVQVVENLPPVAVALADVTSGTAPLTVNFDGTQSSDPEGEDLFFTWIFGDGSAPSLDPSPTHVYPSPGSYVATLTVVDDRGQSDLDTIEITVCGVIYSGDFDEDCYIDFYDFSVLAAAWLSIPADGNWNAACDISVPNDNVIDELDLDVFTGNWLAGL